MIVKRKLNFYGYLCKLVLAHGSIRSEMCAAHSCDALLSPRDLDSTKLLSKSIGSHALVFLYRILAMIYFPGSVMLSRLIRLCAVHYTGPFSRAGQCFFFSRNIG